MARLRSHQKMAAPSIAAGHPPTMADRQRHGMARGVELLRQLTPVCLIPPAARRRRKLPFIAVLMRVKLVDGWREGVGGCVAHGRPRGNDHLFWLHGAAVRLDQEPARRRRVEATS